MPRLVLLVSLVLLVVVASLFGGCRKGDLAIADFTATPRSGEAPLTVQFTDQSDPGSTEILKRHWLLGDGTLLARVNPSYTYEKPGTYAVSLTVTTSVGGHKELKNDYIVVSVPAVSVPNVVGQSQAAVEAVLLAAGLVLGNITLIFHDFIPEGNVISQAPAAGTNIQIGTIVNLVISKGPEPLTVPNVVGMQQSAGENAIVDAGLTLGSVTRQFSAAPIGQILAQDPPADASVEPGTAVDLVVSKGLEPVTVPNVVGLQQSAAESAISSVGLTLGTVTEQFSAAPVGQILAQDPPANTSVEPGTAVDLVVSKGLEPVTVPNVVGLQQSAAESAIMNAGLAVGGITQLFGEAPLGQVLSQDPAAGIDILPDIPVLLVVSGGTVPIPVCFAPDENALIGYCSEGCGSDWGTTEVALCLNSGTYPGDLEIGLVVDGVRVELYDGVNLNHAYGLTSIDPVIEYYADESHASTWDGFVVYDADDTGGDYWVLVRVDERFQVAQNVNEICGCDELGVGGEGNNGEGGTPTMEIVNGRIDVFGIPVHGDGTDAQLVHAATILAEWLDNDEDGEVDNQRVLDAIRDANQGGVCVAGGCNTTVFDDELYIPDGVNPWPYDPATHRFDASIEEILHIVTQFGYAGAYPEVFGEMAGTEIAMALDIARDTTEHNDGIPLGGYGSNAWFHYDDPTCEYNGCQITEYFYWAITSLVGLQDLRCDDIDGEWELCTPEAMMETDAGFMTLYNNPVYTMPRFRPDGRYTPAEL